MKVKSPSQTCGPLTGKAYAHLGHFKKKEFLDAGHNTDIRGFLGMGPKPSLLEQELAKQKVREAAPAPSPQVPAPSGDQSNRRKQLDEEIRKAGG